MNTNTNLASNLYNEENIEIVNTTPVVGLIPDTPYNRIMSFINEYESKNTRIAYTKHYKDMFLYMTGKLFQQLTYQDIKSINDLKVEGYRNFLRTKHKSSTINQKIFACKALWDRFKERRIIDYNFFDMKPLLITDNSYGSLTSQEIENLYDYCLNLPKRKNTKNMTLKLYFEFLYIVTCRKSAAQNLTWNQIKKELDLETGKMIYVITFLDKGKEIKKAIQDEFYQRLKDNYKQVGETSGKVFCGIDNATYDKVLKGFCKQYEIDKNRNICQHSIKGSGLDRIMAITNDINTVALAGQHTQLNTSFKKYLNKNRKYTSHPSYFLGKEYTIDKLEELDKDTLIKLIKSSGRDTILKLNLELEKLNQLNEIQ
jgi:hypothetical protein